MTQVTTADQATEIAVSFVKKHRIVVRPLKAQRQDNMWVVEVDVGLWQVLRGTVRIDALTGVVLDYELPA